MRHSIGNDIALPTDRPRRGRPHIFSLAALFAALTVLVVPGMARAQVSAQVFYADTATNSVTAVDSVIGTTTSIPVGTNPVGVAVNPNGQFAYAINGGSGSISVIDLRTLTVTATILVGSTPSSTVLTPLGTKAYVANIGSNTISIIDLQTNTVSSTISDPTLSPLRALAISPDGHHVYVAAGIANDVKVIDTTTDTIARTIPLSAAPGVMAVSPDSSTLYIVTMASDILPVNVLTDTQGTLIPSPGTIMSLAVTPDGTTILAANFTNNAVSRYSLSGGAWGPDILFPNPQSIAISPDESMAYVMSTLQPPAMIGRIALPFPSAFPPLLGGPSFAATNIASTSFVGPNMLHGGGVLTFGSDADFKTWGFGRFMGLDGGTLYTTGTWTSFHFFSMLQDSEINVPAGADTLTENGNISGPALLIKRGQGTLKVAGLASHGGTRVEGGFLWVSGIHVAPITVTGGLVQGEGIFGDISLTGGLLAPLGEMTAGSVTMGAGSTLAIDLTGTSTGFFDHLMSSSFSPNGANLSINLTFTPPAGTQFTIADNVTPGSTFAGLPEDATVMAGAVPLHVTYAGGDGDDLVLTVDAAPTMTTFLPQTVDEDQGLVSVPFTIGDDFTAAGSLTATVVSTNNALFVPGTLVVTGIGATRSVTFITAPNANGAATITVTVSDGTLTHDESFLLTVTPVNDAPASPPFLPQAIAEDSSLAPLPFLVMDVDDDVNTLTVTATSSDQSIVPDGNIVLGGSGAGRTIAVTPAADANGPVTITVRVSDGHDYADSSLLLTVMPVNDAPTIGGITAQSVEENTALAPVAFTIADKDNDAGTLTVTATSSNQTLVPDASLTLGGSGATRTIAATPAADQHGDALITVTVSDGEFSQSASFTLSVTEAPADPTRTYFLAEGATGPFFDTDILLANPNAQATDVTLEFLREGGAPITIAKTLAATSRTTIKVDELEGLQAASFSTIVTSTQGLPLAVERTMRWDASGYGAHTEKATEGASTSWYFAEGAQGFFRTFFLLANPNAEANVAHVTYFREGEAALERTYEIAPWSRRTVDAGEDAELRFRSFGARVTFDRPGAAERSMYFGSNPVWKGGDVAAGATATSTSWYFAEGATGSYFSTFLLLANPNDAPATVTLTYYPDTDASPVQVADIVIPAGQRVTRDIAAEDPRLASGSMSTEVASTQPIVAERAQYWGGTPWIESHTSVGVSAPGRKWALAEGRVGGEDHAQTYVLIENPGTEEASVTLTFLRTDGTTVVKTVTVAAKRRATIGVAGADSAMPELANESFGTLIESTRPIVVERSLYSNAGGITWAVGTNATATLLREER